MNNTLIARVKEKCSHCNCHFPDNIGESFVRKKQNIYRCFHWFALGHQKITQPQKYEVKIATSREISVCSYKFGTLK